MRIVRLTLSDFRSHRAVRIACDAPGVVITGPNGAGKTNLLEAVSLLAPGRGLRQAPLPDMASDAGSGGFAIAADCQASGDVGSSFTLGTGATAAAPARRRARINGAERAVTALSEWLALIWLTPAMDRLFTDSASGRRRFLDRMTLALHPAHAHAAARYEAAMRARTKLLTDPAGADRHWLAALEAQMAEHGATIDRARRALVAALQDALTQAPGDGFPKPALSLTDALAGEAGWPAERLQATLAAGRSADARAGRALIGPHRQDLDVRLAATGRAAAQCSTGEQKALLLALVLAHGDAVAAARGARPLLLLDEIAAHLDPGRRAALFARLAADGGQYWLTGTEDALFDAVPGDTLRLRLTPGVALA